MATMWQNLQERLQVKQTHLGCTRCGYAFCRMGWALGKNWHFQNSISSAFLTAGRFCHIEALKLLFFFPLPELELSKLFSTLMITDSSTDKEKGDLKQAVTTNMYFALSDQEKEARVSYCHFLIINVKKKNKKKTFFWKCRHENALIWKRSGEKKWQILLTNSALGSYRKMGIRTKENDGESEIEFVIRII